MAADNRDILIVGAGATGLCLALGLASQGIKSTLIGKLDLRVTGRTIALFEGSLRLLRNIGVWQDCEALSAPLRVMRIIDDTGSFFRPPPASFKARDLGLDAFGANIENRLLLQILARHAENSGLITMKPDWVDSVSLDAEGVELSLAGGERIRGALLVGADGAQSPVRKAAGIETRRWTYPQMALTCILAHQKPHDEVSTEFHTRQGPFTFVPLPASDESPHRSSLVWLTDQANAAKLKNLSRTELSNTIERQSYSFLGKIAVQTDPHIFPMAGMTAKTLIGTRTALIGEAAHAFPPIGAQGLNLGLRDVAHLVDAVTKAVKENDDPGSALALEAYDKARRQDIMFRTRGVDMLNRSLLTEFLPVDFLRGAGLLTLNVVPPLRKLIMRTGLMPQGKQPTLMLPVE